jgi:hypothetical protein
MILSRRNLRWSVAMSLLVSLATGAIVLARDRIFVDQWSPTRSELYVADTDGRNARKLVAGLELDYNASFSSDGEWVVFTSERYGSADIFRVRTSGMELERLTTTPPSTIRRRCRPTAIRWRSCPRETRGRRTSTSWT